MLFEPKTGLGIASGLGQGFDWSSTIQNSIDTGLQIVRGRFGTPEGTYTRYGPNGEPLVTYRQPSGSEQNIFGASDIAGGVNLSASPSGLGGPMGWLLLGGGALLLFMMSRRR